MASRRQGERRGWERKDEKNHAGPSCQPGVSGESEDLSSGGHLLRFSLKASLWASWVDEGLVSAARWWSGTLQGSPKAAAENASGISWRAGVWAHPSEEGDSPDELRETEEVLLDGCGRLGRGPATCRRSSSRFQQRRAPDELGGLRTSSKASRCFRARSHGRQVMLEVASSDSAQEGRCSS